MENEAFGASRGHSLLLTLLYSRNSQHDLPHLKKACVRQVPFWRAPRPLRIQEWGLLWEFWSLKEPLFVGISDVVFELSKNRSDPRRKFPKALCRNRPDVIDGSLHAWLLLRFRPSASSQAYLNLVIEFAHLSQHHHHQHRWQLCQEHNSSKATASLAVILAPPPPPPPPPPLAVPWHHLGQHHRQHHRKHQWQHHWQQHHSQPHRQRHQHRQLF